MKAKKRLKVVWAGGRATATFRSASEFKRWKKKQGKWAEIVSVRKTT